MRRLWVVLLALAVGACATYREDLNRGQRLYEESEYERALSIWRYLEEDLDSLDYRDQARYAYLRGMTDYRLGGGKGGTDPHFRAHARHWLALAKAIEAEHPGGLTEQWVGLMEEALSELNAEVWGTSDELAADPNAPQDQAPQDQDPKDQAPSSSAPSDESDHETAPSCSTDADCPAEGHTCQDGQCVAP